MTAFPLIDVAHVRIAVMQFWTLKKCVSVDQANDAKKHIEKAAKKFGIVLPSGWDEGPRPK